MTSSVLPMLTQTGNHPEERVFPPHVPSSTFG